MSKQYCTGCGVLLQDNNVLGDGYTTTLENSLCQRCFRIKNYGEYQVVTKNNDEYIKILKNINKTKDLVLYIVDVVNLEENLSIIKNYITNNMILVINKKDILPKSVKDYKLVQYIENLGLDFKDIIVISCKKNYNIDLLLNKIKLNQTTKNVYLVGHTNSGKSSLINKLISDYSDKASDLTISPLPSTTLDQIEIELNEYLTLIDTPGLVDSDTIVNQVDSKLLKKISIKKEIKPKTYQIRENQSLLIDDILRLDYVEGEKNSFTIYMSNEIKVKKVNAIKNSNLKELCVTEYNINHYEDIVINGLGFIKIVNPGKINVYIDQKVGVFVRKSLI